MSDGWYTTLNENDEWNEIARPDDTGLGSLFGGPWFRVEIRLQVGGHLRIECQSHDVDVGADDGGDAP